MLSSSSPSSSSSSPRPRSTTRPSAARRARRRARRARRCRAARGARRSARRATRGPAEQRAHALACRAEHGRREREHERRARAPPRGPAARRVGRARGRLDLELLAVRGRRAIRGLHSPRRGVRPIAPLIRRRLRIVCRPIGAHHDDKPSLRRRRPGPDRDDRGAPARAEHDADGARAWRGRRGRARPRRRATAARRRPPPPAARGARRGAVAAARPKPAESGATADGRQRARGAARVVCVNERCKGWKNKKSGRVERLQRPSPRRPPRAPAQAQALALRALRAQGPLRRDARTVPRRSRAVRHRGRPRATRRLPPRRRSSARARAPRALRAEPSPSRGGLESRCAAALPRPVARARARALDEGRLRVREALLVRRGDRPRRAPRWSRRVPRPAPRRASEAPSARRRRRRRRARRGRRRRRRAAPRRLVRGERAAGARGARARIINTRR